MYISNDDLQGRDQPGDPNCNSESCCYHLKELQKYFKPGVGMLDEACDRYYQFNSP